MRNFLLGFVVGVIADRMQVNSGYNNTELVSELRGMIKKVDDRLAEKESEKDDPTVAPPPAE